MKTIHSLFRCLLGGGCLLVAAGLGPATWGDRVKLTNGTVVEGNILSETGAEIVIEKQFAGGSITSKETVNKSDVAEVIRSTPAEKAAQEMERAYEATQRYTLDPNNSRARDYYDQVLENSFRKFLNRFPDSAHAREIAEKIAGWEAERDKVAGGQVKIRGQWMDAESAAKLGARDRAEELLRQARALLGQARFGDAAQRIDQILQMETIADLTRAALRLRSDCYRQWSDALQQQQKSLETAIPDAEQRLTAAKQAVEKAQAGLRTAQPSTFGKATSLESGQTLGSQSLGSGQTFGSQSSAQAQAMQGLATAQAECLALENRLPRLRAQLEEVKRTITTVRSRATEAGIEVATAATGAGASTTGIGRVAGAVATNAGPVRPPPAAATEEPELLATIAQLARKYWPFAAGALVVLIWFVSRRLGQ